MLRRFLCNILKLLGLVLPLHLALQLVKRFPKIAHVLDHKGEFTFLEESTGIRYLVDCRSNIDRMLVRGDYEREFSPILSAQLKRDCSAIDCGANIGAVSLRIASLLYGDAKLIAIEPGPSLFSRLDSNIALNPTLTNKVIPIQAGVSDKCGTLFWSQDMKNPGNANLLGDAGLQVPVTTIDDLVQQLGIERVGFIKIDVEGMELNVLKGAIKTIQQDFPVIYYEASLGYERRLGRKYVLEIEELLTSLGYKIGYYQDNNFIEAQYPAIPPNLVALPKTAASI